MKHRFTYKNPVYCDAIDSIRDAFIIEVGGTYYLTGSSPPYWGEAPSPGVKLYSSRDLLNWQFECFLIERSTLDPRVWYYDRFWAPEIHRKDGRYWLTFNCRNETREPRFPHSAGLAVANDVRGPYTVLTHDRPLVERTNDASLFTDDDGRTYMFTSGILGWEVDLDACRLLDGPWICVEKEKGKWDGIGVEGPYVIKRDGTCFMFYSSWTRGYEIGYAVADHPTGPWRKHPGNPFFGAQNPDVCRSRHVEYTGNPASPLVAVGHNGIFTGPDGRDWIVCHYQERGGVESLGFDPLWIEHGEIRSNGPTWTEETVAVIQTNEAQSEQAST